MLKKLLVVVDFLMLGVASNAGFIPLPQCFPCP